VLLIALPLFIVLQPGCADSAGSVRVDAVETSDTVSETDPDTEQPVTACAPGHAAMLADSGFSTVQAAIDAAAPGDTVSVCAGTWTESLVVTQLPLTLAGEGAAEDVVVDAAGSGAALVVGAPDGGDLTLTSLTLTGGSDSAVRCDGGTGSTLMVVEDLRIMDSVSAGRGGGVQLWYCSVQASGLQISGNLADEGGGAWLRGGDLQGTDITLTENAAATGGGLAAVLDGDMRVEGLILRGNQAESGGGLALEGDAAGEVLVADLLVAGNQASHSGGGLFVVESSRRSVDLLLRDLELESNAAPHGGGLYASSSYGTVHMEGGSVRGNTADRGGGAYFASAGTLEGVVVEDNAAAELGGGIYFDAGLSGRIDLEGAALARNWAESGGGIYAAEVCLVDSDLSSGADDNLPDDVAYGTALSWSSALVASVCCDGESCTDAAP